MLDACACKHKLRANVHKVAMPRVVQVAAFDTCLEMLLARSVAVITDGMLQPAPVFVVAGTEACTEACTPCRHAPDVRLHMGYDRWWQQDKEVVPLSQLSDSQVSQRAVPLAGA